MARKICGKRRLRFELLESRELMDGAGLGAMASEGTLAAPAAWPKAPFSGTNLYTNQKGDTWAVGNIAAKGTVVKYQFDSDKIDGFGRSATIEVRNNQTPKLKDPELAYYGSSSGSPIATDDDSLGSLQSRLRNVDADEWVKDRLAVRAHDNGTGKFLVSISGDSEFFETMSISNRRGSFSSSIGNASDYDFVKFRPSVSGKWTIAVTPNSSSLDPTLMVFDSDGFAFGQFWASDSTRWIPWDKAGSNRAESVTLNMNSSFDYYIRVDGFGTSTGSYTVTVRGPTSLQGRPAASGLAALSLTVASGAKTPASSPQSSVAADAVYAAPTTANSLGAATAGQTDLTWVAAAATSSRKTIVSSGDGDSSPATFFEDLVNLKREGLGQGGLPV